MAAFFYLWSGPASSPSECRSDASGPAPSARGKQGVGSGGLVGVKATVGILRWSDDDDDDDGGGGDDDDNNDDDVDDSGQRGCEGFFRDGRIVLESVFL